MSEHNIGWAVSKLWEGQKVRRHGWNNGGMWLALMPSIVIPAGMVNGRTAKFVPPDVDINCGAYIAMWTAKEVWQPGWVCSQADLLASDWEIAE
tara:strand:+ start:243 stop:524 length:282 start_codon:yes stop_codon:yes gene_type:complete